MIILCGAAVSSAVADDACIREAQALEGEWKLVSSEVLGLRTTGADAEKWRWVVRGDQITLNDPLGDPVHASYKIDSGTSPKRIDITWRDGPEQGGTSLGIYKLDGSRLIVCMQFAVASTRDRPKSFKADDGLALLVWEKVRNE
jgi:uncharacterized protein (TIGR03067 family)